LSNLTFLQIFWLFVSFSFHFSFFFWSTKLWKYQNIT
jgi:hypothetical protein